MKRLISILIVCVLTITGLVMFSACGKGVGASSNSTAGVVSNGGTAVQKDSYLYFINGKKEMQTPDDNITGKVMRGGIYRIKLAYNCAVEAGASAELVVSSNVGYKYGSLYIFGNYLYYTTPSVAKNNSGAILYTLNAFWRINLSTKQKQLLYTTKAEGDVISYSYYKSGTDGLFLMVFEEENETLTSIEIGTKPKVKVIENEVLSVVFSDNMGEGSAVDTRVYYTKEPESSLSQGVDVFSIKPNGKSKTELSVTKDVSLLAVRAGKLIYTNESGIYASNTVAGLTTADTRIATQAYENTLLTADGAILVADGGNIKLIEVNRNGDFVYTNITEDESSSFIGVSGDILVYLANGSLHTVNLVSKDKTSLFSESVESQEENMIIDIVGEYVYFFYQISVVEEEGGNRYSYMHRLNINETQPAEKAEFIGRYDSKDILAG